MTDTWLKLWQILEPSERRNAGLILLVILGMAVMEIFGIVSILPFVAIVSDPGKIQEIAALFYIYDMLDFSDINAFLVFIGVAVAVVFVVNLGFRAFGEWVMSRYAQMRAYSLGSRLLRSYLSKEYEFFLNRHSADMGAAVLAEVNQVVGGALVPALQLLASTVIAVSLFALLMFSEPVIATLAFSILGTCYFLIYVFARRYLASLGARRNEAVRGRFKTAHETLSGAKELKFLGKEFTYLSRFRNAALRLAQIQIMESVVSRLPSYLMQGLFFMGMMLILLHLLLERSSEIADVLPTIVLFVLIGNRAQTAMQNVFQAVSRMKYSSDVVGRVHQDLVATKAAGPTQSLELMNDDIQRLPATECIALDRVSYSYPGARVPAISAITLEIRANTTVGFVGATGSGKTTTGDVLLGLLSPQEGRLLVDGREINRSNLRAWQRNIGYVPQHIFLLDASVAENIAFGIPSAKIDRGAVERAAKIANLHEFVVCELSNGYDTYIGERGIRLSGGQRQRIGVARALYHDPNVIILDEATSALDNLTERAVMEAIGNLESRKTIVLIAHRLSTVRHCRQIFMMDKGRILASGTYDELLASNSQFRLMATA